MPTPLFEPAPDFNEPIAVLKHCHDRIRKLLNTLEKLPPHLSQHGANGEAQQAASSILRYFDQAAPNHHEDEEHDLLPMLRTCASGPDAELLDRLVPEILHEHVQMEALWQSLAIALRHVAAGEPSDLQPPTVLHFSSLYSAHMEKEETHIAPMAKHLFDAGQMARLGQAMKARRGID